VLFLASGDVLWSRPPPPAPPPPAAPRCRDLALDLVDQ
jgi:hypothetical protein